MDFSKQDKHVVANINKSILEAFKKNEAYSEDRAIHMEELNLPYSLNLQYYLVEEFIRNDFMRVVQDGKIYLDLKKYEFEKKKVQTIYIGILLFPFVIAAILAFI